jgi:hypothetical protein
MLELPDAPVVDDDPELLTTPLKRGFTDEEETLTTELELLPVAVDEDDTPNVWEDVEEPDVFDEVDEAEVWEDVDEPDAFNEVDEAEVFEEVDETTAFEEVDEVAVLVEAVVVVIDDDFSTEEVAEVVPPKHEPYAALQPVPQ